MHFMVGIVRVTAAFVLDKSESEVFNLASLYEAFGGILTNDLTKYEEPECRIGPDARTLKKVRYGVYR